MPMVIWSLLIVIGVVAMLLLGEIRRVRRDLDESIRAHYEAIRKIPDLEDRVRVLTKRLEALNR